ncbi:hypothetical protein HY212_05890 [Candidatus Pacearchaeota archaeon]|nr:hypothetical protein [Candidatus Pacearchaeota archaeon]
MPPQNNIISTGLGEFSKEKFNALVNVRAVALESLRHALTGHGPSIDIKYTEVTTSSLVNIAGSCENPNASFTLNYYGREAHLSQSAQIQLEALVMRLKRGFFTVNNSFREENFDDPEAKGRRLSEFTLIEPERPYNKLTPEKALEKLIEEEKWVIQYTVNQVEDIRNKELKQLGADIKFLRKCSWEMFPIITYDEALAILSKQGKSYEFGHDFGIEDERAILRHFGNLPTFVTYYPSSIKFFNMKRTNDGKRVYSVDLLMPSLGETTGGAIREENGEVIKRQLRESKIGKYLSEGGQDPIVPFIEYFSLFDQEPQMLRGGYGIGFERFVGFLLGSNDILETISYKTLKPS